MKNIYVYHIYMEIIDIMAVAIYFLTENDYRYTYNKHF